MTALAIYIFEPLRLLFPPSLELLAAVWIYLSKLALNLSNFWLKVPSGLFSMSDLFLAGIDVEALDLYVSFIMLFTNVFVL